MTAQSVGYIEEGTGLCIPTRIQIFLFSSRQSLGPIQPTVKLI